MGKILVTGAAGFIGFHLARRLLNEGAEVIGLDNLSDYYDVRLKQDRLAQLQQQEGFRFAHLALEDRAGLEALFRAERPDRVVNLAAQVGVRYSLHNPHAYVSSNVVGFLNVLEGCRQAGVAHLVFASSSSVYGANTAIPYSVHQNVDHPISVYAATKKSNELLAHAYAALHALPVTGLRFFTVYGPWGRPDMAPFLFTRAILHDEPLNLYNHGRMKRDFTYVEDVVESVARLLDHPPAPSNAWSGDQPDPAVSFAPYRLYNVGNSEPVTLLRFVEAIEQATGKTARKHLLPLQPGDMLETYAEVGDLAEAIGYQPQMPIEEGVRRFVAWYHAYYTGRS